MKQKISFLLALVMLLGLFAGCGEQGGETQPSTEPQATQETTQPTEPEVKEPPRTAEDFLAQLRDVLKERNIPVELVFDREIDDEADSFRKAGHRSGYSVHTVDENGTQTYAGIMLWFFTEINADPLTELQILTFPGTTQQGWELYPVLSGIASALCDRQMTEEKVAELFALEPAGTSYATYTEDIGSYSVLSSEYIPDHYDFGTYSVVFCQPNDLTHSLLRIDGYKGQYYKITFANAGEGLYADKTTNAPTVAELESRINDAFADKGVPIACILAPYQHYGEWRGVFRYTTLEKADYAYPEFPYEEWGYQPEEVGEEMKAQFIRSQIEWVDLSVYAVDPVSEDAPVSKIQFWDAAQIPELAEVLCIACDPENGAVDMSAIQSVEPVEGSWEGYQARTLQKNDYSITQEIDTEGYGSTYYVIDYEAGRTWNVHALSGEALLDPALLDYEFQLSKPMVVNGLFNYYDQSYQTLFYGSDGTFMLQNLLNDFLEYTRSDLSIDYYWDNGEHYSIYAGYWGELLDQSVFRIDQYDVAIDMYYNVNIQDYLTVNMGWDSLETENLLRLPIGISLLMDESMTVEEAIQLHTHTIGYDFIASAEDRNIAPIGYQVTVYGTGDVVHILAVDPETGANSYSAVLRGYVEYDSDYSRLKQYLDD